MLSDQYSAWRGAGAGLAVHPIQVVADRRGVERGAVMECHPVPQLERPGQSVLGLFPGFGERRLDIGGTRLERDQAIVDLPSDPEGLTVAGVQRIEHLGAPAAPKMIWPSGSDGPPAALASPTPSRKPRRHYWRRSRSTRSPDPNSHMQTSSGQGHRPSRPQPQLTPHASITSRCWYVHSFLPRRFGRRTSSTTPANDRHKCPPDGRAATGERLYWRHRKREFTLEPTTVTASLPSHPYLAVFAFG